MLAILVQWQAKKKLPGSKSQLSPWLGTCMLLFLWLETRMLAQRKMGPVMVAECSDSVQCAHFHQLPLKDISSVFPLLGLNFDYEREKNANILIVGQKGAESNNFLSRRISKKLNTRNMLDNILLNSRQTIQHHLLLYLIVDTHIHTRTILLVIAKGSSVLPTDQ